MGGAGQHGVVLASRVAGGPGVDAGEGDTAAAWRQGHCRHSEGEEGADRGSPCQVFKFLIFPFSVSLKPVGF